MDEVTPEKKSGTDWLETPTPAETDWLDIKDTNEGKVTRSFQCLIDACMRGTNRVMACDGAYLAYRPFNREFDKETNPRTKERFQMFIEKGFYRHIGTYDEVQIYELLEGNPYRHDKKQYVVGQSYQKDIDTVARLALERKWSDYHDFLGGMATAIKSGRDPLFAKSVWDDTLTHILVRIKQLGGPEAPSEREINEGFVEIRRARGITGRGGIIALPPENSLNKVEFKKGGK